MTRAYAQVVSAARRHECDLRTAAYIVGVRRVADAIMARGIYP
jgi:glutamate dehydrogenase/leucine dehydrogenase